MDCSTSGFPVLHQLPELARTHVHWVSDTIQPSQPLSSPSPLTFNLSQPRGLFQWVSTSQSGGQSIGVSASTSVLPMNIQNIPVNISFRMDWLDLLVVQRTLKSLLQHQSSKGSILQWSAFFTARVQPQQEPGVPSGWRPRQKDSKAESRAWSSLINTESQ